MLGNLERHDEVMIAFSQQREHGLDCEQGAVDDQHRQDLGQLGIRLCCRQHGMVIDDLACTGFAF